MSGHSADLLVRQALRRPATWALSHARFKGWLHDFGIRPMSHSTMLWIREDPVHHTRVTLRNYFSLNYGIPNPEYSFALHDADGYRIATWRHAARPDETVIVDSRELAVRFGLGHEFTGTLVAEVRDRKLDPPRFLRANVDYYNDEGMITTVHDQGRLVRSVRRDAQSLVYVREDSEYETGIVLQNWYRFRRNPSEYMAEARIELLNHAGERRSADAPQIAACSSRYLRIAELFPDAQQFLGGKIGGMRIHSNIAMGRSIPVVRARRNGFSAVSHTVGDHDPQIYARELVPAQESETSWAPVWSSFVEEGEAVHTDFSVFNNWLPRNSYDIDLRLYDETGRLRSKVPAGVRIRPDETKVLSMKTLLAELNVAAPFRGLLEARLAPRLDQSEMPGPGMFQVNTVWSFEGGLSQSNNQSLGHLNTAHGTPHALSPKRTKMFGRIVSNSLYDTVLSLMNPSSDEDYGTASDTEITVYDASGKQHQSRRLTIPPHGSIWMSLEDLFPNLPEFLNETNGISSLVVIDRTVKLTGYLGVRNRKYQTMGVDHLFGG